MYQILKDDFGNPSSIHHFGRKAKMIVEQSRKTIANYLSASIGEVFFTSGATESCHSIFYSAIQDLGIERIISSVAEHHCTTHTLSELEKKFPDIEVCLLPTNQVGRIDMAVLTNALQKSEKKTLVSLMHGNNEIGTLHDLKSIGEACKEHGALFMVDAAQTFGKYPINVNDFHISFLTASAHKLFGPKGTGLMYINSGNIIQPLFHGGSQERNMRSGTENVHGIGGFAKATELALANMDKRQKQLQSIKEYAKAKIGEIEDIQFNGCEVNSMAHILSVSFPPSDSSDLIMFNLDIAGICASSGSACSSGVEHDSHVLQAIGHDPKRKTIRFSFSHETSKEEIDF
ncbi:UNVERIFIED_CONTAM: hypothetical protein GTU68_056005, partial [Idotea baltica]|nr:hypothetical protein [Idotea baltica]